MEKKHQTKPQAQKWKGVFHSWFRLGNIITKVKRKASFNHVPVLGSPVIRGKGGCRRSQASGQPRGAWPWSLNVGASLCIPLFCTKQALPFTDGHWGIKSILGYWCSRRPFFFSMLCWRRAQSVLPLPKWTQFSGNPLEIKRKEGRKTSSKFLCRGFLASGAVENSSLPACSLASFKKKKKNHCFLARLGYCDTKWVSSWGWHQTRHTLFCA